jgi:uncharacterized protein (DUF3820 family)
MPCSKQKDQAYINENYLFVERWTVRFGKYKGRLFRDVPDYYLEWAYANNVFTNEAIIEYIAERLAEY